MCRMLAVVGKTDVELLNQFQDLALIGKIRAGMEPGHHDGWGIAGFKNLDTTYFGRSADSAHLDTGFAEATEAVVQSKTPLFLGHIRKASSGQVNLHNTHPFIKNGWLFAHNGTIYESEKLPIGNATLDGTTDSERFFTFLISKLRHCSPRHGEGEEQIPTPSRFGTGSAISEIATPRQVGARNDCYKAQIKAAIKYVWENNDYTSLTFLLANSKFLIAYRDFNEKSLETSEYEKYYTLELARQEKSAIICSEPIAQLNFQPLKNKQLIIITNNNCMIHSTFLK